MKRLLAFILLLFRARHGRPVAAAMLSGFALLILFPDHSPFKTLRVNLFDTYQTYLPRERKSAPVIIVGIDETSLKLFGQWPWPRTRLAELIDRIASFQPAAIGIDIIMPEHDRASPARMAESWPKIDPAIRRRLISLPDNDHILAAALTGRPVVLGAAGFDHQTPTTAVTMRTSPIVVRGGDATPYVRHFRAVLKSLPELENAAAGQALLTVDLEKGVVRRLPLIATIGETLVPTLSLEMLRVASGLPAIEVEVGSQGIASVGLGDVRIPTQANGEAWVHFSPFLPERYISAADLFAGRVNPDSLQQKLVLVGLTGLGLLDFQTTPRGERVPGIEAHAQLLENIFDKSFLQRPAWMPLLELAILLLSGVFLLYAVPALKPRFSTMLAVIFAGSLLGLGFLLYCTTGLLFDAASLSMSLNTVFASLLGSIFIETDHAKIAAQTALQIERVAAAYMAGELEAAQRIQMGSLPQAANAFPGEKRFSLDALLEPAREVGGDLYDFYMLDQHRLFFIVGDVAGKGLPASLFMVMTKALTKSIVKNNMLDLNLTLKRLNGELFQENPEMFFVTVFAAILDTEQGVLDYCIAGHDAPWRIDAFGAVNQLTGEGNPPLSVMDDIDYPLERVQLSSGEAICVVTDGIIEAMNAAGELYGRTRPIELLERKGRDLSASGLLALLRDDVRAFVGNAEQSDDLALLVVRWYGPHGH
jgi:adenylate cyclase